MAEKNKLPERIGLYVTTETKKALQTLSEVLKKEYPQLAKSHTHNVSDIVRCLLPSPAFIQMLAEIGLAPMEGWLAKLLEEGLRTEMKKHKRWRVVRGQLDCSGELLLDLYAAWWKAMKGDIIEDGTPRGTRKTFPPKAKDCWLEKITSDSGKLLGYRVHYPLRLRLAKGAKYDPAGALREFGYSDEQIQRALAELNKEDVDG